MEPKFETVVEQYSAPLYRLAYSWCATREDAEDVVQETFLKYLRRHPQFQAEAQRRAWLMTVTVNGCRDVLRSRSHIEMQTFQDALKAYARRKDKDLRTLVRYARLFRVEKILRQYLEVLL